MIFVTGGTGFLGAYLLADLVKSGKQVKALKRSSGKLDYTRQVFDLKFGAEGPALFNKITWIDGNIMDIFSVEETMQGADEVYHCATEVSLRDENPDSIIQTAEKGTENMVNIALEKGVKKFCHVSSVSALGEYDNGKEINEDAYDEFSWSNSPYAIGKHLAEAQVWRAHAEGLNVVVVNPSIIFGPWKGKAGSMSFFHFLNNNSTFYTTGTMGFTDVQDVVNIMIRLMDENKLNERYLINSENVSFHKLFTDIAQRIGKKPPTIKMGRAGLKLFRAISNVAGKTKITKTMVEHSSGTYIYSNKKVIKDLGYTFIPVTQTIEQSAKYFLHERNK